MFVSVLRKSLTRKMFASQMMRQMSYEIPVFQTVANHKPLKRDESLFGGYASALFITASKSEALHIIMTDLDKIVELENDCPQYKELKINNKY